jgi:hypothetical protein
MTISEKDKFLQNLSEFMLVCMKRKKNPATLYLAEFAERLAEHPKISISVEVYNSSRTSDSEKPRRISVYNLSHNQSSLSFEFTSSEDTSKVKSIVLDGIPIDVRYTGKSTSHKNSYVSFKLGKVLLDLSLFMEDKGIQEFSYISTNCKENTSNLNA